MPDAVAEYEKLTRGLTKTEGVSAGQMFGKQCLKINGKAFVAQHEGNVIFKLSAPHHEKALAVSGAKLWDPSGKGRPMKEWVALPASESRNFTGFAWAALEYVLSGA